MLLICDIRQFGFYKAKIIPQLLSICQHYGYIQGCFIQLPFIGGYICPILILFFLPATDRLAFIVPFIRLGCIGGARINLWVCNLMRLSGTLIIGYQNGCLLQIYGTIKADTMQCGGISYYIL